jgi:hypothetical protein
MILFIENTDCTCPHEGEAFTANWHAPKVPPDEGGLQGGKITATEPHRKPPINDYTNTRITISPFNHSTIQQFNK